MDAWPVIGTATHEIGIANRMAAGRRALESPGQSQNDQDQQDQSDQATSDAWSASIKPSATEHNQQCRAVGQHRELAALPQLADDDGSEAEQESDQCQGIHASELRRKTAANFGKRHNLMTDAGGGNRVGPNLHGVFGREIGTQEGFAYSQPVQDADFVWDADQLDHWLANPQTFLPGNRMAFAGVRNEEQRRDVIAYLLVETGE